MQISKGNIYCMIILSVLFIVLMIFISSAIYKQTKYSYKNVGYNDGSIQTKIDIIRNAKYIIGAIDSCDERYINSRYTIIPFIEVKSTTLYIIKYNDREFYFCLSGGVGAYRPDK